MSIRLGVNIDHVATLRNARGEKHPDPYSAALSALKYGADSITIHLREDRRHINDVDLKKITKRTIFTFQKVIFSLFQNGGYKISILDKSVFINDNFIGYDKNYFLNNRGLAPPITKINNTVAKKYEDQFPNMFIMPKLMYDYGTDQITVQRMMSTGSLKNTKKAIIFNAISDFIIISLLILIIFFQICLIPSILIPDFD